MNAEQIAEGRRLWALIAEAHEDVVADRARAEGVEGRYGYGSPESDAAWAEVAASRERLAAAHLAMADHRAATFGARS